MKILPSSVAAALLVWAAPAAWAETKAWQDTVALPTWPDGTPETTPQFGNGLYPYAAPARIGAAPAAPHEWRRLNLENEYLACSFLPDFGGRLYSCTDKINGLPVFYKNPSIKKADLGTGAARMALGVEWNFPVAHGRDAASPVSFGFRQEKDRAVVWVGDTDRSTGMEWLSEFVLRDGSAVLEQNVTLRNPTEARHPYQWWSNAAVAMDAGTRFVLPAQVAFDPSAGRGVEDLDSWPRGKAKSDLSDPAAARDEIDRFAFSSREPFMAVYNASSRTATVHVADAAAVMGKHVYSWGAKKQTQIQGALTGDQTWYVEMGAGLFENQDVYRELPPHGQIQFTELWLAGRGLSGVTRANRHAILSMARQNSAGKSAITVELNVTYAIAGARIRIASGPAVFEDRADLTPSKSYSHSIPDPAKDAYRFELRDSAGVLLMAHTEGIYEAAVPATVTLGPQPAEAPMAEPKKPAEFLAAGGYHELRSEFQLAEAAYQKGLTAAPKNSPLLKAMGRLMVEHQRYAEAEPYLTRAAAVWLLDPEVRYYQGLAFAHMGKDVDALKSWAIAAPDAQFGPPAMAEAAALESRMGNAADALGLALKAKARNLQVALLRRAGKSDEARTRLAEALAIDPLDPFLRAEAIALGSAPSVAEHNPKDDGLWSQIGAAGMLELADKYFDLGMYVDGMKALDHTYSPPLENPLIAYYRGYARQKLGQAGAADFQLASTQKLEYVFPNRAGSEPVLRAAIAANAQDASAHFLLGLLYLNEDRAADAVSELKSAKAIRKDIPEIDYALARALLEDPHGITEAIALLKDSIANTPAHGDLQRLLAEATTAPKERTAPAPARPTAARPAPARSTPEKPTPEKPTSEKSTSEAVPAPAAAPKVALKPADPVALAAGMLELTANGQVERFDPKDFPQEKQPDSVRRAYIEMRLQDLRRQDCRQALLSVETIGDENTGLPFTMYGFGEWMKGARFQFYLGAVEASCGDRKAAERRWAKVVKMTPRVDSSDFAFTLVAAQNMAAQNPAAKGKAPDIQSTLDKVLKALANAGPDTQGPLLYSEGVLLLLAGDKTAAVQAFLRGAKAADHDLSHYLNTLAVHEAAAQR